MSKTRTFPIGTRVELHHIQATRKKGAKFEPGQHCVQLQRTFISVRGNYLD